MMLEKKKDVRKTFISLVAVALFLALVLVLDHVIIGDGIYVSLHERGVI